MMAMYSIYDGIGKGSLGLSRCCTLAAMQALGKLLDHLFVKGRDVIRLSARYEAIVDDDFAVDPVRSGVDQVGPD